MLKNYLKIALRNFRKQKVFSIINILGLTVGITVLILIALNIKFEYSFNNFHKNSDRIYRVAVSAEREEKSSGESYIFVPPIGPAMLKDFPEVENFVRFSTNRTAYFTYQNESYKVENITYSDSSLFKIFSFKLLEGNPQTALVNPYSILLTENTASTIFRNENPIGKTIFINGKPFDITGIIRNPPPNSDIRFNSIISFSTLYRDPNNWMGWNGGNQYITYILLKKNASAGEVDKKFTGFLWQYINKDLAKVGIKYSAYLQPLKDIHLTYNLDSVSLRQNIYIYSAIALFILLIACANFINLSTAKGSGRAREVGMRKVLGARRKSLISQFLSESVLICLVSLILSLMLVELLLPWYNNLIGKHLALSELFDSNFLFFLFALLVITGLVAGFYPAFFLSSYKPASTLKGNIFKGKQKQILRQSLVILQFVISIVLIISTLVIQNQLDFIRTKNPGFNKENIVVVPLTNTELKTKYQTFKSELKRIPGIVDASASSDVPANGFTSNGYFPEGYDSPLMVHVIDVDEDFLKTFNIKIIKGRNFEIGIQTDKDKYIINQSLAKYLNWKNPINKLIRRNGSHRIIGEVQDFNYASLYYNIEPLIITHHPWQDQFDYVSVKINAGNIPGTLNSIQQTWNKFSPGIPFEYFFLDQTFDQIYKSDIRSRQVFFIFSILAVCVALLGLIGLASYSVESRRKEIGIRKVLGSSVRGIIILLNKEYSKWILIANVIAFPAAYYIMSKWLQEFAFKVDINWLIFIVAGGLVFILALLVVGIQVMKAALINPVESLRYE